MELVPSPCMRWGQRSVGSGAEGIVWAHRGGPGERPKERASMTIQEESQAGSAQLRAG